MKNGGYAEARPRKEGLSKSSSTRDKGKETGGCDLKGKLVDTSDLQKDLGEFR